MAFSRRVAYLRDSSAGLDLPRQRELIGPVERTWTELQPPGTSHDRPVLREALDALEEGDALVVASADRIARSLQDLRDLVAEIGRRGACLELRVPGVIIRPCEDHDSDLVRRLLAGLVEAERAMAAERQAEAVVSTPPSSRIGPDGERILSDAELRDARLQLEAGLPPTQVAREHGVTWPRLRALLEQPELPLET